MSRANEVSGEDIKPEDEETVVFDEPAIDAEEEEEEEEDADAAADSGADGEAEDADTGEGDGEEEEDETASAEAAALADRVKELEAEKAERAKQDEAIAEERRKVDAERVLTERYQAAVGKGYAGNFATFKAEDERLSKTAWGSFEAALEFELYRQAQDRLLKDEIIDRREHDERLRDRQERIQDREAARRDRDEAKRTLAEAKAVAREADKTTFEQVVGNGVAKLTPYLSAKGIKTFEKLLRDTDNAAAARRLIADQLEMIPEAAKKAGDKAVIAHNAKRAAGSRTPPPEGRGTGRAPAGPGTGSRTPAETMRLAKNLLFSDLMGFRGKRFG